jgi:hypothetical protein
MKYIKRILVLTTLSLLFSGIQITSAQETQKPAVPAATPAPRPQFRMPPRIVSPEMLQKSPCQVNGRLVLMLLKTW